MSVDVVYEELWEDNHPSLILYPMGEPVFWWSWGVGWVTREYVHPYEPPVFLFTRIEQAAVMADQLVASARAFDHQTTSPWGSRVLRLIFSRASTGGVRMAAILHPREQMPPEELRNPPDWLARASTLSSFLHGHSYHPRPTRYDPVDAPEPEEPNAYRIITD